MDYLESLTTRLAEGLARLPPEHCVRHIGYLAGRQNPDGGWSGREGGSDLYYTAFALRGLAILGGLTPETAGRAGTYLRGCLVRSATVIDFFSLLYAGFLTQLYGGADPFADSPTAWPDRVVCQLNELRTSDGGFAKSPAGASGSTYHTFLVFLCYQLLRCPMPEVEAAVRFVQSRRRDDGGFVEVGPMKRSGANPTAAAVGVLQMAGALDAQAAEGVSNFLKTLYSPEGGIQANARAPLADLLSTFTASWTLTQIGAEDRLDREAVSRYIRALEQPNGGFRGGSWDAADDVEYTFYGLGCMALFYDLP